MMSCSTRESLINHIRLFLESLGAYERFHKRMEERILGQPELPLITSNVFAWLKGVAYGEKVRNNMLLAAPSGCGKTEIFRAMRDILKEEIGRDVPVIQLDVTQLTPEGFVGKGSDEFLWPLFEAKTGGIGIVVLDEFDKRAFPMICSGGDDFNFSVQSQMLTWLEGTVFSATFKNSKGEQMKIDTANTLFIGAGAYQFIRDKRKKEIHPGFGKNTPAPKALEECPVTKEDILKAGASNELIGRFPMLINLHKLGYDNVSEICRRYAAEFEKVLDRRIMISEEGYRFLYKVYQNSPFGCRVLSGEMSEKLFAVLPDIYLGIIPENAVIHYNGEGVDWQEEEEGFEPLPYDCNIEEIFRTF